MSNSVSISYLILSYMISYESSSTFKSLKQKDNSEVLWEILESGNLFEPIPESVEADKKRPRQGAGWRGQVPPDFLQSQGEGGFGKRGQVRLVASSKWRRSDCIPSRSFLVPSPVSRESCSCMRLSILCSKSLIMASISVRTDMYLS